MSDAPDLRDDVLDELAWDAGLDATAVGVAVRAGVVTLTGCVHSYAEKRAAERAAHRVRGVAGVVNELDVRIPDRLRRADADIAAHAATALRWTVGVPIDVTAVVENGCLTLEGVVQRAAQRRAAERAVRDLIGVRDVTNLIHVRHCPLCPDAEPRIREALRRSAQLDAERIEVAVEGGIATLTGHVRSWSELLEAEHTARAATGVTEVVNRLQVTPSPALLPA
ncbi:MAG TPA: BON domain-containing protein [Longimicrobiales bacterium]